MPSTYTTSLRLTLPANGELAGTWGTTVNAGVTSLAEAAIAGTAAVAMIDADYTLSVANGSTDQARNMFVTLTGTLSAARNVICPPVSKLYFVTNNTTGGYAITFKTLAGTGVSVPNGQRAVVYCNGTDVVGGLTSLDSLSLNGSLTLVGGTANGVAYLNGSKVVTTGASLTFDGTNFGVGTGSPGAKLDVRGNATFTGNATARQTADFTNTGGQLYVGTESSAGGAVFTGAAAYAGILGTNNNTPLQFASNGSVRATLDATGNLGLGVTPSAWSASYKAYELPAGAVWSVSPTSLFLTSNAYNNGTNYIYKTSNAASQYQQGAGAHTWSVAASGTAGATFSFTTAMTLTASGNLGIGTNAPSTRLQAYDATSATIRATSGVSANLDLTANATDVRVGTPNGVPLLFLTGNSERARIDSSGNLGLGVTPSAWVNYKAVQFGALGNLSYASGFTVLGSNAYQNGTNWIYQSTNRAVDYYQDIGSGTHVWRVAPSGTAGNPITFTTAMTLDASGNLGLKFTPSAWSAVNYALQGAGGSFFSIGLDNVATANNVYYDGAYKYVGAYNATMAVQSAGQHAWLTAAVGTAGAAISWTTAMTLTASGNLGIGTASPDVFSRGDTRTVGVNSSGTSSIGINAATGNAASLYVGVNGTRSGQIVGSSAGLEVIAGSGLPLSLGANFSTYVTISSAGNLGIGTTSPTSTLHVIGSFSRGAPVLKSADFTLAATENWIVANKAGSACVATLPAASSWTGREVTFKNVGAFSLNSASSNITQLPGGSTQTSIAPAGRWATLVSDGTNWVIVASGIS